MTQSILGKTWGELHKFPRLRREWDRLLPRDAAARQPRRAPGARRPRRRGARLQRRPHLRGAAAERERLRARLHEGQRRAEPRAPPRQTQSVLLAGRSGGATTGPRPEALRLRGRHPGPADLDPV